MKSASSQAFRRHALVPLAPEDFAPSRTADGQQAPPLAQSRLGYHYGDMLHHREHDLYHAPPGAGGDLQDVISERLRAERFDELDVTEWAFRQWHLWIGVGQTRRYNDGFSAGLCDLVVKTAIEFRETGMPNDEAFSWFVRGVKAPEAVRRRNHGWNPWDYGQLLALCSQGFSDDFTRVDEWATAPIPSWRCLRYLKADIRLHEALHIEARRERGEDTDAEVDLLIALITSPA